MKLACAASLSVILISCAAPRPEPDLRAMYRPQAKQEKTPIIVIPGLMGSRLVDRVTGEEEWPGSLLGLVLGTTERPQRLAVAIGDMEPDALVPRGLFYEALGEDFYGRLVTTLTDAGGYKCAPADQINRETDCVLLSWDWRRDLVEGAIRLDSAIERLRTLRNDPDLKVDVVGHSAGGIITRYYLRFGRADVLDEADPPITSAGAGKIRKAVLVGVPNFGSIFGLQQVLAGRSIGGTRIDPELMATMPSLFQILPHPDRSWMVDLEGRQIDRNLYDLETWQHYGWSIYHPKARERIEARRASGDSSAPEFGDYEWALARSLIRGEKLHRVLSKPVNHSSVQYVVFGGGCISTPARCLLEHVDGEAEVRIRPEDITNPLPNIDYAGLMLEPGDGQITKFSLMGRDTLNQNVRASFPADYVVFICGRHAELPGDVTFRDNLLTILLY